MIFALFEDYRDRRPRLKRGQAAGLAVSLAVHALFVLGAVTARYEVKMLSVEKKISSVIPGPRVKVDLPADYEKHLADISLLESEGGIAWGDVGRTPGRGREEAAGPAAVGPSPGAAGGAFMPEGASGSFVLSYRPGSEKSEVSEFDLRPPSGPDAAAGRPAPGSIADPRLKSYPSTDIRRGAAGAGYALARSATGDRVIYRGRLPAGAQSVELASWGRQVVEAVQKSWMLPLSGKERKEGQVSVTVVVEKDGRASLIRIDNSSNLALLDRSALAAITASLPFPSLPEDFPGRNLEAFFLFDCHEK